MTLSMWDYLAIGNSGPTVSDYYNSISSNSPDYAAIAAAVMNSSGNSGGSYTHSHNTTQSNGNYGMSLEEAYKTGNLSDSLMQAMDIRYGNSNTQYLPPANSESNQIEGTHDYNRIFGTSGNDKLKGGKSDDVIFGDGGLDNINGRKGDDIIFPGEWSGGMPDKVKGGKGTDVFVLDEYSFAFLKDFKTNQDFIGIPENAVASFEYNSDSDRTDIWINGENAGFVKGNTDLSESALWY